MKKRFLRNVEWGILVCSIILLIMGLIALFSATQGSEYSEFKKQIVWFIFSVPIIVVVMLIDYNTIAKISPFFYVLFIILLIGVLFTEPVNGATSWYEITENLKLQPSELAKIFVIMFVAIVMVKIQKNNIVFYRRTIFFA